MSNNQASSGSFRLTRPLSSVSTSTSTTSACSNSNTSFLDNDNSPSSSPTNRRSYVQKHNLEAAAAALDEEEVLFGGGVGNGTGEDDHESMYPPRTHYNTNNNKFGNSGPPNHSGSGSTGANANANAGAAGGFSFATLAPRTPMQTQSVRLRKPLFFGHQLPPQVIEEARAILAQYTSTTTTTTNETSSCPPGNEDDHSLPRPPPPSTQPFPPEIQNMISALRTYGHGFDLLKEDSQASPYVTVYCPKWSERIYSNNDVVDDDNNTNNSNTKHQHQHHHHHHDGATGEDTITFPPTSLFVNSKDSEEKEIFSKNQVAAAINAAAASLEPPLTGENKKSPTNAATPNENADTTDALADDASNSNSSSNNNNKEKNNVVVSERDLFSMWARGEDNDEARQGSHSPIGASQSGRLSPSIHQGDDSVSSFTSNNNRRRGSGNASRSPSPSGSGGDDNPNAIMSDRDLFSQWARGESPRQDGNVIPRLLGSSPTNVVNTPRRMSSNSTNSNNESNNNNNINEVKKGMNNSMSSGTFNFQAALANHGSVNFAGTFMNLPAEEDSDNDDDDLVVSEMKKKVGMNEHLNAALAYLEDEKSIDERATGGAGGSSPGVQNKMVSAIDDSNNRLIHFPLTPDGGRPLTNFELMNGVSPLFGCDDSSLPMEADLGIHETRDEQQRSRDQRRNQAIIESCCPHNIFGPLACPSSAVNPDDNHSWMSRASWNTGNGFGSANSNDGLKNLTANMRPNKKLDPRLRYGWWNTLENTDKRDNSDGESLSNDEKLVMTSSIENNSQVLDQNGNPLQLPPIAHPAANSVLIDSPLKPNPETLYQQNRSLSELHPATSLAQTLPFLSDRPPSFRHLQIDTQAVGFLGLGGEVEPLFCSLAIYHVETLPSSITKDPTLSPMPDLQRCGKVTESLHFDVVSDASIEEKCRNALWPYSSDDDSEKLQGTRCGVFPLPSNLNVHNLYAILIVHKVVADASDFEPYLQSNKTTNKNRDGDETEVPDLRVLRSRAEKACKGQGTFIMPFAFGVAPLLQVFGADVPTVPSSRAVQIPLFQFSSSQGERQIIDHIMVMLYPRADHYASGIIGPAPGTNRGTAMLVMRNFGFLGLHSVVDKKSSLARDRLVDFTRQNQIRRKAENEASDDYKESDETLSEDGISQGWHKSFVAEPTRHGGRNKFQELKKDDEHKNDTVQQSPHYAQELAPLRISFDRSSRQNPLTARSQRGRGHHVSGEDIEPYFLTSFCNELLCHPRFLHNCPKGNIVLKIELREIEWLPEYEVFAAHLPKGGPSMHNNRRGPALVQAGYSSCSAKGLNPVFLDEFKIKLPLAFNDTSSGRRSALFYTCYRLSFSGRKKWGKKSRSKVSGMKVDEIAGKMAGDFVQNTDASTSCHLIQLCCGFTLLSPNGCAIADGMYDVKMKHMAYVPKKELVEQGRYLDSSLILSDLSGSSSQVNGVDDLVNDTESVNSSFVAEETGSMISASESVVASEFSDVSKPGKQKKQNDLVSLQLRITINSSVHCQNSVMSEYFGLEPDLSLHDQSNKVKAQQLSGLDRDKLLDLTSISFLDQPPCESNHDTERLLTSTIDIAKISMCPILDVSEHIIRIVNQLLKIMVYGTGEFKAEWVNPMLFLPLRIQAFASLLQILGTSTIFTSRKGLLQLDGANKWNLISLGRVLALEFDEEILFGEAAREIIDFSPILQSDLSSNQANEKRSKQENNKRRGTSTFFETFSSEKMDKNRVLDRISDEETSSHDKESSTVDILEATAKPKIKNEELQVDSVMDFRNALKTGSEEVDDDVPIYDGRKTNSAAALSNVKAFNVSDDTERRYMTAPSVGLATIREDGDCDDDTKKVPTLRTSRIQIGPLDALDSELYVKPAKAAVKQMRVPNIKKNSAKRPGAIVEGTGLSADAHGTMQTLNIDNFETTSSSIDPIDQQSSTEKDALVLERPKSLRERSKTLPTTDAEIETAGMSFLDAVEMSLLDQSGLSNLDRSFRETSRPTKGRHRKTRSSCSIDWSVPDPINKGVISTEADSEEKEIDAEISQPTVECMTTIKDELEGSFKLPSYVDRLVAFQTTDPITVKRWFPFTYEVIILQWMGILRAQRDLNSNAVHSPIGSFQYDADALADAASRSNGVAIACAPVLFELIKQSLGWRISHFRATQLNLGKRKTPFSVVILDEALVIALETIVESVALACIDFRNFDLWETRKTCIDVNDSMVFFLRDMFAYLSPDCVCRLIRVYFSNLCSKSANVQERDSNIGLRCSWEVTKLQLDAVSCFMRFSDFVKVNSPMFHDVNRSLALAVNGPTGSFFDTLLRRYDALNKDIFEIEGEKQEQKMHPHWLSDIVVEVCLIGTEHAETDLQRRAAALLMEMLWKQSQDSLLDGSATVVASVYVKLLKKILARKSYIAKCFPTKSQVRQDLLRCIVFILQSAPEGLMCAVWRQLFSNAAGKSVRENFGFVPRTNEYDDTQAAQRIFSESDSQSGNNPDIYDMFSLINLALATFEYEGKDEIELSSSYNNVDKPWKRDYLLSFEQDTQTKIRQRRLMFAYKKGKPKGKEYVTKYSSTSSRIWHAHDGSIVLIKTTRQIVRELQIVLESTRGEFASNSSRNTGTPFSNIASTMFGTVEKKSTRVISLGYTDSVVHVRAAFSVFLHALTLNQSDIVYVTTFQSSSEMVKAFGIKLFIDAVGETLQHWMRIVTWHCGSRRAEVRIQASDFLEHLLRSTWETFGSFFRIRLPFLAVQTDVMERIMATAAARYYHEQHILGAHNVLFTNGSAEASLSPLWRTLDRLQTQSASQNVAFRSALTRLAEKVKKLFRAIIAAHALEFLEQIKKRQDTKNKGESALDDDATDLDVQTAIRASKISIQRVVNAGAGYSKQFLGLYNTSVERNAVAHNEAVEDAFLAAADVFSPTELPDHRVAWLRKLALFHATCHKYAEEATCHYNIHITLQQASSLHGALWFSTPFFPWTKSATDGSDMLDTDSEIEDPVEDSFGGQIDKPKSYRRIFYRNENSLRMTSAESEGTSKFAFCGVTMPSEYSSISPWSSIREMEANMLEEAESAGHLFLKAGIVASSRYAWSLAVRHYAEKFSYKKLKHVYENLADTVVSEVPPMDLNQNEISVTVPLGRFYRVWFHGGAPDELIGAEFVYRTASSVNLEQFGHELKAVIRCIIPDNTPIHLVLDGRAEEREPQNYSGFRIGAQLEPVRIKVTPLRAMVRKSSRMRGVPEWFRDYIDTAFPGESDTLTSRGVRHLRRVHPTQNEGISSELQSRPKHRGHNSTYSASVFSSSGNATTISRRMGHGQEANRHYKNETFEGDLVGADKFSFMVPINKGRDRGGRDWLRGSSGDFAAKRLRVTQLQVGQAFPACVSRQSVVHRVVFTQSPLEAASDSICQWCAILFRTAIATKGREVLGTNFTPGIGIDAAKIVNECIHSSRVKEMGLYLLKRNTNFEEEEDGDVLQSFDRLSEDEVKKLQLRLARSLVVFMELLHLMISRNRQMLLDVIQERKRSDAGSRHSHSMSLVSLSDARSTKSNVTRQSSANDSRFENSSDHKDAARPFHKRKGSGDDISVSSGATEKLRTDAAIGIQSELQRAFISLSRELYPRIHGIMGLDTPRWIRQCGQENYFSSHLHLEAKIPIGEELSFDISVPEEHYGNDLRHTSHGNISLSARSNSGVRTPVSPGGSLGSNSFHSKSSDAGRSQQSSKKSMRSSDHIEFRRPHTPDRGMHKMSSM